MSITCYKCGCESKPEDWDVATRISFGANCAEIESIDLGEDSFVFKCPECLENCYSEDWKLHINDKVTF